MAAEEAAPYDGEAGCTPSQVQGASKLIPGGGKYHTLHSSQNKLRYGENSSKKMCQVNIVQLTHKVSPAVFGNTELTNCLDELFIFSVWLFSDCPGTLTKCFCFSKVLHF